MGLKLSCCIQRGSLSRQVHLPAPARVIAADGSLKELPMSPLVAVSDVLGLSGDAASSFFVCNSDALYFNMHPPALAPGELLRPGQIYFVLRAAMLGRPLSSAVMAALAVRASTALASSNKMQRRVRRPGGNKKGRVMLMPVLEDNGDVDFFNEKLNEQTLGEFRLLLSPAKSNEKLAAAAARSRLKCVLSNIQEDAE
ncbi:uncharacterized protein LOC133917400 [Phragmites australis]|uniref:uncharacterized protein LOC133917400 n=1 Tax=Phragmites australis TaxID=29695 RepID=UPI002D76E3D8|nr:uncharacterized protein LOC133917400 [Phragmites australis]